MPDAAPEHVLLSEKEHQERLRRWIVYLWEPFKRAGLPQTELARALGISKQTVGDYLSGDVAPGFECFLKLHFKQGLDPLRLLREEPRAQPTPALHPPAATSDHPQDERRSLKSSRRARK